MHSIMSWSYFMHVIIYPSASMFEPSSQREPIFSRSCAGTMAGVGRGYNRFVLLLVYTAILLFSEYLRCGWLLSSYEVPPSVTNHKATRRYSAVVVLRRYSHRVHITKLPHGNPVKWATKVLPSVVL